LYCCFPPFPLGLVFCGPRSLLRNEPEVSSLLPGRKFFLMAFFVGFIGTGMEGGGWGAAFVRCNLILLSRLVPSQIVPLAVFRLFQTSSFFLDPDIFFHPSFGPLLGRENHFPQHQQERSFGSPPGFTLRGFVLFTQAAGSSVRTCFPTLSRCTRSFSFGGEAFLSREQAFRLSLPVFDPGFGFILFSPHLFKKRSFFFMKFRV